MRNRTALVIGASGGIGRAVTARLLRDEWFVCATYAHEGDRAAALCTAIAGASAQAYALDVTDAAGTERVLAEIVREHPDIRAVVFAPSAPLPRAPLLETAWGAFDEHLTVQVRGLIAVLRGLREHIRTVGGIAFVVVTSELTVGAPPAQRAPYVVAKHALMGLAKCMAVELAQYGCRTNIVLPGLVATDLTADMPRKLFELEAAQNPLKRIATPEDVAGTVAFLTSDDAKYLNGVQVTVNGGSSIL